MSNFQDNFKREQSGEDDELEYDDSAFYFFSMAVLTFIVFPFTLYLLWSAWVGEVQLEKLPATCKCS